MREKIRQLEYKRYDTVLTITTKLEIRKRDKNIIVKCRGLKNIEGQCKARNKNATPRAIKDFENKVITFLDDCFACDDQIPNNEFFSWDYKK